jgi:parallel beta-helix repeat protein
MNGFFEPRLAMLIVVVAGALALVPAPASGHHIACGDVVTADAALDSDLSDCPGDGIVIGADGISVDLNGHTIDGDDSNRVCEFDEETGTVVGGPNCFWDGTEDYGIDNGAGHDRVAISNGTVKSFAGAAVLLGHWVDVDHAATDNHLRGLTTVDSNHGFLIVNSDGNSIEGNSAHDNRLAGIWLSDSSHNLIERNRVSKNLRGGITLAATDVEGGGSVGNRLYQNVAVDNVRSGIELLARAGSNHVRGNVLRRNEKGILAGARDNRVEENLAVDNVIGIAVEGRNTKVTGNRVTRSTEDGIAVGAGATGTLIAQNVTNRNGDDGIDTDQPATTLTGNFARWNFDLGIEAVAGVLDGGANRAWKNGNPVQCLNVACRRGNGG